MSETTTTAEEKSPQRLFVYNGGFLTSGRIKRILQLSGFEVKIGMPGENDLVGVWGKSPTSPRGEAVARSKDAAILRVEDAFLRSVHPGRSGSPPLGLFLDKRGVHFDYAQPSDLEVMLATHPLDDTALLNRARAAIDRLKREDLSKYNSFEPKTEVPKPGYVLVIDQTKGDASIKYSGADANSFREMLYYAREENPSARIVVKTHPETQAGHREGHFGPDIEDGKTTLFDGAVSPWALLDGATKVYTVSSQLGFEAIFAGHKPHVFGRPFYMGWGLTDDRSPLDRRQRRLTRAQLFAAAMILYPKWYDPFSDELCTLERAIDILSAEVRCYREDKHGWVGQGMRLWKRPHLQAFFGAHQPMRFERPAIAPQRSMVWANKIQPQMEPVVRVEDGFLRSRGLGADLIPPLSLVCDQRGIYYDPSAPSDLELFIERSVDLDISAQDRAEHLRRQILKNNLSKYNLRRSTLDLPKGYNVLVPGQVEDDASILKGTSAVRSNHALLEAAREAHPEANILYKPHPDVEAGLRDGDLDAGDLADRVLAKSDPIALLSQVDEVWTMTSLLGFEALIRGVKVTTLGAPFYAGWGLTTDLGDVPSRRRARPNLQQFIHAVLIDYPRYFDPKTGLACPPEVVVNRLAQGDLPKPRMAHRALAKLQGAFASYAYLWR
ncbi:capsular polysaccharide biosynthesis protein [Algirhabdus cladophorae]|uniref:capsular polysaccharide biosynthesis protein n=1 Tax=Algirhabdus cladophorae TaxID=3377108 RepID=UPI003B846573